MFGHEKVSFLHLPTPVEKLENLSKELGIELYIKRDDLTGLGAGGNKLRKLEYFLKDAQDKGCTALVTVGGAQTNHGRLTAAVAAKYGMKCSIVSEDDYPGEVSANILLDRMMGAEVVLHKGGDGPLKETSEKVMKRYEEQGEKPYYIPMGGSNALGALGYYECAQEILKQMPEGRVVVTVGSMGTYMGLFCGLHDTAVKLTGVMIAPFYDDPQQYALDYFAKIKADWGLDYDVKKEDFDIKTEFTGGGYNNLLPEVREAMYEMARREAIIIDPCYTGKTYVALKKMVANGTIAKGEKVLFIHTGGMPGINTPHHRKAMEKELFDGITIVE